jgi:hypothetical protein
MPAGKLTKKIFLHDFYTCNNNWSEEIAKIMNLIDMSDTFISQTMIDVDVVRGKLNLITSAEWEQTRFDKPKLRYFNMYKSSIDPERYVIANISKRKRSIIAQFRSGILPLMVETGRFRGLELHNRTCPACKQSVEDEFHFLMQCPAYHERQDILFARIEGEFEYFARMDDLEKFIFVNMNCQLLMGSFLLSAWDHRKQFVYET